MYGRLSCKRVIDKRVNTVVEESQHTCVSRGGREQDRRLTGVWLRTNDRVSL
jgi:hypothetical protein